MEMKSNSQIRFVLIERKSSVGTVVLKLLNGMGVLEVHATDNGTEAWKFILDSARRQAPVHCVVSDWNTEGVTGIELLRSCRAEPQLKDIGFLMVTAEADAKFVQEAVDAGVDGYIVKPFSEEVFTQKVTAVIEKIWKRTGR